MKEAKRQPSTLNQPTEGFSADRPRYKQHQISGGDNKQMKTPSAISYTRNTKRVDILRVLGDGTQDQKLFRYI